MNDIKKYLVLKNNKRYIIELNDIPKYLKGKKVHNYMKYLSFFMAYSLTILIRFLLHFKNDSSNHLVYIIINMIFMLAILADLISIFIFFCLDSNNILEIDNYIDCFENKCRNIDFSKPINIDEDYNILYFNKNQELQTLHINYDDIQYVADSDDTIKLIGKYIGDGGYEITLYLPVEMSNEYKNYIEKS